MTRIGAHNPVVPVPVRTNDRRIAAVNAPSGNFEEEHREAYASRGDFRRRTLHERRFGKHAPAPALAFSTQNRVLVGLQNVGEQERARTIPNSYEAAARYEDRYFELATPGLFGRKYA